MQKHGHDQSNFDQHGLQFDTSFAHVATLSLADKCKWQTLIQCDDTIEIKTAACEILSLNPRYSIHAPPNGGVLKTTHDSWARPQTTHADWHVNAQCSRLPVRKRTRLKQQENISQKDAVSQFKSASGQHTAPCKCALNPTIIVPGTQNYSRYPEQYQAATPNSRQPPCSLYLLSKVLQAKKVLHRHLPNSQPPRAVPNQKSIPFMEMGTAP